MWTCKKCGACCRLTDCPHLTDSNLCDIYDLRPDYCRMPVGQVPDGLLSFHCTDVRFLDKLRTQNHEKCSGT